MANVLLLTPPNREPQAAARDAIAAARSQAGRLVVAVVLDPEVVERLSTRLEEVGLMGERVSDTVRDTLLREYRARAETLAQEIAEQAHREGVLTESVIAEGDPSETCSRLVRQHDVALAILVAERRSWLTRLLSGSAARVPELPGCEVRVMEG